MSKHDPTFQNKKIFKNNTALIQALDTGRVDIRKVLAYAVKTGFITEKEAKSITTNTVRTWLGRTPEFEYIPDETA